MEQKVDAVDAFFHPENYVWNDPDYWLLIDAIRRDLTRETIRGHRDEGYPTLPELREKVALYWNTSAAQNLLIEFAEQQQLPQIRKDINFSYCKTATLPGLCKGKKVQE